MPLLPAAVSAAWDRRAPAPVVVKVPPIAVGFWVIKVLTTGTGEAASDYLVGRNQVVAVGVGLLGLIAGLVVQWRSTRFVPWLYWLAVSMVAVFGTMAADAVHVVLGVPYPVTSIGYALAVAGVFAMWYRSEATLDIHSVITRRREAFYWAAVLATFALGTAVGDLSAFTLGMGFLASAGLYAVLIAVPAIAWWKLRLNPVVAFWAAYVLTRPLGASLADWIGKPTDRSGLGLGDGTVTVAATLLIICLVGWETFRSPPRPGPGRLESVTRPMLTPQLHGRDPVEPQPRQR